MVALHHDPFALLLHNRHATLISLVYLYTCPSGAERVPTCTFMVPEAHGQRHCAVWILLQMGVPFLYLFFFVWQSAVNLLDTHAVQPLNGTPRH